MRILIGIQARTNSTRLPKKVLEKIGTQTILERVYKTSLGVKEFKDGNDYIISILGPKGDYALLDECDRIGAHADLYEKEEDVLGRYVKAAKEYEVEGIVRITADCIALPIEMIKAATEALKRVDYVSNCIIRSFPEGFDIQGCSAKALAWFNLNSGDREHLFQDFEENSYLRKQFNKAGMTIELLVDQTNPIFQKTSIDTQLELENARKKYS